MSKNRPKPFTSNETLKPFESTAVKTEEPSPDECGNCRYWQARSKVIGLCRLQPSAGVVLKATDIEGGALMALPVKAATEWCGQHSRK